MVPPPQHVLDQHLIEHTARFGLSVGVLPKAEFPQGQVFHHNKPQMQSYVDGRSHPCVAARVVVCRRRQNRAVAAVAQCAVASEPPRAAIGNTDAVRQRLASTQCFRQWNV